MKKLYTILVLLILAQEVFSCCWARQFRNFPIGIHNGKIVVVQMDLIRRCEQKDYETSDERWSGPIGLFYYSEGSYKLIQNIDTIDVSAGLISLKTGNLLEESLLFDIYRNQITPYYLKAIEIARSFDGFIEAKPEKMEFYDSDENIPIEFINDSVFNFENTSYYLDSNYTGIFDYPTHITEIKNWSLDGFELKLISFNAYNYKYNDKRKKQMVKCFKDIEKAVIYTYAGFHGNSGEYLIVIPK